MRKRIWAAALALIFTLSFTYTAEAQLLYEEKSATEVYTGLRYESSRRVTDGGLLDVHVLTVDLTQGHLSVKPVASQTENGLKEQLTQLLSTNGAVAGVNGDFFGMAGEYSIPLGLAVADGRIASANESFNLEDPKSATLFLSDTNMPFIEYIQTDLRFLNDGAENVKLNTYNLFSEWTCYLDQGACLTTAEFDERFPGRYKIVVKDQEIIYISEKGETVVVPDGGYVVTPSNYAAGDIGKFAMGQRAEVLCNTAVDLSRVSAAISGAGKILSNGVLVEDGMFITGRHPRTALGVTADRRQLIMMVVDGRSHSIGATHAELGQLLQEYGAYDAMHLDGGGSSTVAVRESLKPFAVKNVPSDGAQRKVINGLGVFNLSTLYGQNPRTSIEIETSDYLFAGIPSRFSVYGLDQYRNRTELREGFAVDMGDGGYYADGFIYPSRAGYMTITVTTGTAMAVKTVRCGELAQIGAPETVRLQLGEAYSLNITGKCADGYASAIDTVSVTDEEWLRMGSLQQKSMTGARGVSIEVIPPHLAVRDPADPTQLIGTAVGAGYIKYSAGGVERYARLIVGVREEPVERFAASARPVHYVAYPTENAGSVGYVDNAATGPRLELAYQMAPSNETQAAYIAFDEPIAIPGQPTGLKLALYGDNSNNWLRGRVSDAEGAEHVIDFARVIDWEGYKTVEAKLPAGAAYPVKLERIYVAALENTDEEVRRLYFDSLAAVYPIDAGDFALPESTPFIDRKLAELGAESRAFTDVTLLGDIVSAQPADGYQGIQDSAKAVFNTVYGEQYGIFFGDTDNISAAMPVFRKTVSAHSSYKLGSANVISLTAAKGNMFSSDPAQWQQIEFALADAGGSVLVLFDKNPLTSMPRKEQELLQRLFVRTGKNIIVVSSEGSNTTSAVFDNVRYVNLGGLFTADGRVNEQFKTLRVRFYEEDLRFSLN